MRLTFKSYEINRIFNTEKIKIMKIQYLIIALATLLVSNLQAQSDTLVEADTTLIPVDTTKITFKNKTIIIISKGEEVADTLDFTINEDSINYTEEENRWTIVGVFNMGANGYLAQNGDLTMPKTQSDFELDYANSRSIGFDFMIRGFDMFNKRMYFSPGLGIEWNKYHFKDKQLTLLTSNDTVAFSYDSTFAYDKYKLRTTYIQAPLLVGFRLGNLEEKTVNIQFGAIAGYNIGAVTKEKHIANGIKYKNKVKDDYNVNPFKLDAVARVSFGSIGIFGRYSFTTLFEKNKAPELIPFSVGITLGSL